MATYNKFQEFVEDLAHGDHNFQSDSFVVALTAAANAPVATNSVLLDLTEIAYTNLSSRALTPSTFAQTSGTYTQLFADLTLTASGSVATFRYVVIYNDTPSGTPADPLIAWYDYGSDLSLTSGETLDIDWTTSTFTLA